MIVKSTLLVSLYAQIIALVVGLFGIVIKLDARDKILQQCLILEEIVQVIEFSFYIFFSYFYKNDVDVIDIAKYRYYDWFLTTPTMIVSTIGFFEYNNTVNSTKILNIFGFVIENLNIISRLIIFNFFMLLMGYLKEYNITTTVFTFVSGFLFFIGLFYTIWNKFARYSIKNYPVYFFMLIVWSIYGFAILFKQNIKNSIYNILDIFSKNFYNIFLTYIIYTKRLY